ncbi:unnamed protein product [Timema podura]|uniref:Uncharacterized protein n=1 Tax=Timema podura TaxID=61482 RepID=A0ABN7PLY6_TIMPD|nr:unnamed protein product [Timema podura]
MTWLISLDLFMGGFLTLKVLKKLPKDFQN